MTETITRILDKLEQVRQRGLACFGSEKHQFQLNPPLPEQAVAEFERRAGVRLPEDYRCFLLEAGNGGAGPYYGLLPLERWDDAESGEPPSRLALPCPLRPDMPEGVGWTQALNCEADELFQGTLALVEQGCTYCSLLVVSGEYRGRVINVDLERHTAPYFVHNPGFLSWYERWLDELLWGYEGSWFGFGLPGREVELLAATREQDAPPERVRAALVTLVRIPSLKPETLAAARLLLRHPAARVREQAAPLFGKHGVTSAADDLKLLLADEDAAVRKAALSALAELPGVEWELLARAALRDPECAVVFQALCLLKQAASLRYSDVVLLQQSTDAEIRRYGNWAAQELERAERSGSA
jgi:hypothetical protein